jgi:hypothetical protein
MTHIEAAILERLRSGGPCCLDDIVTPLSPNYSWSEVFIAVDRMSRDGEVLIRQLGYFTYQIALRPEGVSPVPRRVADGGDGMTENEVQTLRTKWKQRVDLLPCEHLSLELEEKDLDRSTGNIFCFTCGELVAQGPLAAQHPHKSDSSQTLIQEDSAEGLVLSACRVPDAPHVNRKSDAMRPLEAAILEKLRSGSCWFDDIVTSFPDFRWGELFVAVEGMSRDGRVSLRQNGYSTYQMSLGSRFAHSSTTS